MTRVACVGIAVLDVVFQVDRAPSRPGKYRAQRRTETGGGPAANAAVTIARLGGEVAFLGAVGADAAGDRIIAGLAQAGVDTSGVRRVPDQESPLSAVLVDAAGERTIVNHAGAELFTLAPPVAPDEVASVDAVLVDMRWRDGAIPALDAARLAGIPAIVDCDHDPRDAPGILEASSHVVFALETLQQWTGHADPAAALAEASARTGAWVAATAGSDGVMWRDGDEVRHRDAFAVDVVDTLGAGDVLHGAFALALAEGADVAGALRFGSAAAAIKCTRFGGRTGIPHRDEVERFLEEQPPWT